MAKSATRAAGATSTTRRSRTSVPALVVTNSSAAPKQPKSLRAPTALDRFAGRTQRFLDAPAEVHANRASEATEKVFGGLTRLAQRTAVIGTASAYGTVEGIAKATPNLIPDEIRGAVGVSPNGYTDPKFCGNLSSFNEKKGTMVIAITTGPLKDQTLALDLDECTNAKINLGTTKDPVRVQVVQTYVTIKAGKDEAEALVYVVSQPNHARYGEVFYSVPKPAARVGRKAPVSK
jgi:hypothetical protein